jgi:hypothetical protein
MVVVVHAFPEVDDVDQDMHLRYWYGTVHADSDDWEDSDEPVVCWCGARHVVLAEGTLAVWHLRSWADRSQHG